MQKIIVYYFHENGDIYDYDRNQSWFSENNIFWNSINLIDIASHYYYDILIARSANDTHFVWGNFGGEVIEEPNETEFKSIDEIFIHYFGITYKNWNYILVIIKVNLRNEIRKEIIENKPNGNRILKNLSKNSNNKKYSYLKFKIEGKQINK